MPADEPPLLPTKRHSSREVMLVVWVVAGAAVLGFFKWIFDSSNVSSQNKAVLGNLRFLAAASDQYFLENGVTVVSRSQLDLVEGWHTTQLHLIDGESYPTVFMKERTLTATGVAGQRTITYQP